MARGGQSATPDSENLPKIGKKEGKNQENSGKNQEKSRKKRKNQEDKWFWNHESRLNIHESMWIQGYFFAKT